MREPNRRELEVLKTKAAELVRNGATPESATRQALEDWEFQQTRREPAPEGRPSLSASLGDFLKKKRVILPAIPGAMLGEATSVSGKTVCAACGIDPSLSDD